jgi:hypothetical protein
MDYKTSENTHRYLARQQARDTRIFATYMIGLAVGIAVMTLGTGLVMVSEKAVTTGLWHTVLQAAGKGIDLLGLVLMLGCFGLLMDWDVK